MFKVFPKSFYKRKSKRQREPSRIPMRKLLNRFKKRCFRKPMKRFILQNIPSSSNLHNLYKYYQAWRCRYDRDNVCRRKAFSTSFMRRNVKEAVNSFQFKSVYKSNSSNLGSEINTSPSSCLQGGMDPQRESRIFYII